MMDATRNGPPLYPAPLPEMRIVSATCGGATVEAVVVVTVTVVPDWVSPVGAAAMVRVPQMLVAGPGVLPFEQLPRLIVVFGPVTVPPVAAANGPTMAKVKAVAVDVATVNVPL